MLSETANEANLSNLRCLGYNFELLLEIYRYGALLALMAENAKSKSLSHMSRLERSLVSTEVRRSQNVTTQPLAVFLQDMGIEMRRVVDAKEFGQVGDRQVPNLYYIFEIRKLIISLGSLAVCQRGPVLSPRHILPDIFTKF